MRLAWFYAPKKNPDDEGEKRREVGVNPENVAYIRENEGGTTTIFFIGDMDKGLLVDEHWENVTKSLERDVSWI